ncbi:MAG: hypothetical protein NTNFB02_14220 [Nitrospira sp.]
MAKRIAVVITEDPRETHRPVEALRIALGLSAGDHETTVVLLGPATRLLTEDTDDVIDVDILERYRPSFQQLAVRFVVDDTSVPTALLPGYAVEPRSRQDIQSLLRAAERTVIFT